MIPQHFAACSAVRSCAVAVFCLLLGGSAVIAAQQSTGLFSADGYRIADFRSPVPGSVPGGFTVTTKQVQWLLRDENTVLIDVMPTPVKPKDRPPNLLWLPPARYNIPGSVWLPNVGFGALSKELEAYFSTNLQKLSDGDISRTIIIYCLADCWMSWNAAKRAVGWGYTRIHWYPDGTTGWEVAGLPLEKSQPLPMKRHAGTVDQFVH